VNCAVERPPYFAFAAACSFVGYPGHPLWHRRSNLLLSANFAVNHCTTVI
jgi:hypothetical protein